MDQFPGLNLHDRLVIVVPDQDFADTLRSELSPKLASHFGNRRFELVDSKMASAAVLSGGGGGRAESGDGTASFSPSSSSPSSSLSEWLVLDTIDNVDGLERLIVVGVGLDERIERAAAMERRGRRGLASTAP